MKRAFVCLIALSGLGLVLERKARESQAFQRNRANVRTASLGGRNYVRKVAASRFATEEEKVVIEEKFEMETTAAVVDALGNMKGAMMKIGQMASFLDQGMPEHVRSALRQLQSNAPPMAFSLVVECFEREFGTTPDKLFRTFTTEPIAAASIGQVHRAQTVDGNNVAVKVQYPHIAEAIEADLKNSDILFTIMSSVFSGMDPEPLVSELRERITEELDYENEAETQRFFHEHYTGHPYIHVPKVYNELSTQRILTTEFVEGASFYEMCEWPQDLRNQLAETVYRFAFGGIYQLGCFNGDPHPGNYLFHRDGSVTFLDFGLSKRFSDEELKTFMSLIDSMVIHPDIPRFRSILEDIGILRPAPTITNDMIADYFGHFYEFVRYDKDMAITPEYSSETVRRYFDLSGPYANVMKQVSLPAFMVVVQRINLGLFALFGEMETTNNWRLIAEDIWPETTPRRLTPMGEEILEWERGLLIGRSAR